MHDRIKSGEHLRLTAPVVAPDGETRVADWHVTRRHGRIYTYLVRLFGDRRSTRASREDDEAGGTGAVAVVLAILGMQ